MSDNKDRILIFAGGETAVSAPDARRGLGDAMKTATAKASEVAVSTLQENMRSFLNSLDTIISAAPKDVGGFVLDEVEIFAQIDSKGKTLFNFFWVDWIAAKKINHRGRGGHRALLFLRVLCALCGFPKPTSRR